MPNLEAAPAPAQKKSLRRDSCPRTTMESLFHPTKRTRPDGFHTFMLTVGSTRTAQNTGPSFERCAARIAGRASTIDATHARRMERTRSARIGGSLQHVDLLTIGERKQLAQRRVSRIIRDCNLELV